MISTDDNSVDVLVIPTNEEWMMAHHAQALLSLQALSPIPNPEPAKLQP